MTDRPETAITSTPAVLNNEPSCGAPQGWRWGYLPCGCRNDGYGNHINLRTSRLDEADAWAAKNGSDRPGGASTVERDGT